MCGIIGIATRASNGFTTGDMDVLLSSMYINMFRGADSTGLCIVEGSGAYDWLKDVGGPGRLVNTPEWAKFKSRIYTKARFVFGHGRAATKGTVTVDNAHPFEVFKGNKKDDRRIILVHNGTLSAFQTLPGFDNHKVDSEWLAQKIADIGPEEALAKVSGPMALIWYDTEVNEINFFRNHERPLSYVKMKDGTLLMNSEKAALMWLKYKYALDFVDTDVHEFVPGTLYTCKSDHPDVWIKEKKIEKDCTSGWSNYRAPAYSRGSLPAGSGTSIIVGGIPQTDYALGERTMMRDAYNVCIGKITEVSFYGGKRITRRGNAATYAYNTTEVCDPYEKGLARIVKSGAGVELIFANKMEYLDLADFKDEVAKNQALLFPNTGTHMAIPYNSNNGFLAEGQKFTWTTVIYGMKNIDVKHKLTAISSHSLKKYQNTVDGVVMPNDSIIVDLDKQDIINTMPDSTSQFNMARCIFYRPKEAMDAYIDFLGFMPMSAAKPGRYSAKISCILPTSMKEYTDTRSYVRCILTEMKYLGEITSEGNLVKEPELIDQVGDQSIPY